MILPECHETSNTERLWIIFHNEEYEKYLNLVERLTGDEELFPFERGLREAFWKAGMSTGTGVTPQILREVL